MSAELQLQATIARDLGDKLSTEIDWLCKRHLSLATTHAQRMSIAQRGAEPVMLWLAAVLRGELPPLEENQDAILVALAACAMLRQVSGDADPIEQACRDVVALMEADRIPRDESFITTIRARA